MQCPKQHLQFFDEARDSDWWSQPDGSQLKEDSTPSQGCEMHRERDHTAVNSESRLDHAQRQPRKKQFGVRTSVKSVCKYGAQTVTICDLGL